MNFVNYILGGDYTCTLIPPIVRNPPNSRKKIIAFYSGHKQQMLWNFVRHSDLHILLHHEAVLENFNAVPGYQMYYNIGTMGPGTVIVTRNTIPLQRIDKLPSGSGTALTNQDTLFVNIYVPFGNNKRQEREAFFNTDLIYLLRQMPQHCVLGSDFNCVTSSHDRTNNCQ